MREGIDSEYISAHKLINTKPGTARFTVAGIVSLTAGIIINVGLYGLGIPLIVSIILSLLAASAATVFFAAKLPREIDDVIKKKKFLCVVWFIIAAAGTVQILRLSVFMINPQLAGFSLFPADKWMVEHCCLTAYTEGARFSLEGGKNIYDPSNYFDRRESGFNVDLYHYPPPFLLLPVSVRAAAENNFLNVRAVWFALNALTLLIAMGLIIYKLMPEKRLNAIGTAPLIWFSFPVLAGLQMSNVQIMVVSISIISMVLISNKFTYGGIFLAMSSVAKIFPAILLVHLGVRRKWKEIRWILAFAVVLILLSYAAVGFQPFKNFIEYELPRLSSGEAFSRPFSRPFGVARNMAPFGIPVKLSWLGVDGMSMGTGRIVSSIFLMGVIGLAVWAGRRKSHSITEEISVWISLLSLGTLVSPFAPANYVLVTLVLLVCLNREVFNLLSVIIIWIIISIPFMISRDAPFLIQFLSGLPAQILAIGIPALILWKAGLKERAGEKFSKVLNPGRA